MYLEYYNQFPGEATGFKDGKKVRVAAYVNAPGCVDAFEKSGLSRETYFTGQEGSLFTKLIVNDKIIQKGLISSDMLEYEQVDYFLAEAAKLDITLDTAVEEIKNIKYAKLNHRLYTYLWFFMLVG